MTTGALLEELNKNGNQEAVFRYLFEAYYVRVQRFFQVRGLPPEDCRDLTQETFLAVFKGLRSLREEEHFEGWLFTIALNVWRREIETRKAAKRSAQVVSLDAETADDFDSSFKLELRAVGTGYNPAEFVLEKEQSESLLEAIHQLPEQMRRCIYLRVKKDLLPQEIADLLGLSVNTVKAHLQQAQKALRQKLGTTIG